MQRPCTPALSFAGRNRGGAGEAGAGAQETRGQAGIAAAVRGPPARRRRTFEIQDVVCALEALSRTFSISLCAARRVQ